MSGVLESPQLSLGQICPASLWDGARWISIPSAVWASGTPSAMRVCGRNSSRGRVLCAVRELCLINALTCSSLHGAPGQTGHGVSAHSVVVGHWASCKAPPVTCVVRAPRGPGQARALLAPAVCCACPVPVLAALAQSPRVFGQRLEDTVQHERKSGPRLAPLLVEQCVDFIREHGLTEEGLFRMPGQANLVRDLQGSFDCGEKPVFDRTAQDWRLCSRWAWHRLPSLAPQEEALTMVELMVPLNRPLPARTCAYAASPAKESFDTTDVHTVASLLKLYLRELPEPVVPFARYEDFLSCAQLLTKDEGEGTLELAKQVSNLPQANYNLLRYICKFLDEVQAHSDVNKMSVQNLATVFGPNILRPQLEDPVTMMEGTSLVQHLMTVLIRKHAQLFATTALEGPASPHRGPPCTVGWGSEEATRDSQEEHGGPGLPAHRTSSLDGAAVAVLSRTPAPALGPSSGKRVQTLPSWKSSFRQPGARSGSPKGGSSSLEVPIISGGNWLMNGLSSLRGHRRASSGDRLKDSGSAQRLSTCDNVPPPGPPPSTPSAASPAWSAASSSCEASAGGSLSSCTACRASDSSPCSSLHTEWALEPSPLPSSSEDHRSPDLGHSLEEVGAGVSSSEPSDPGSPGQDHARRVQALQGLVAELRAQLCRQRTEYEASVKRDGEVAEKGAAAVLWGPSRAVHLLSTVQRALGTGGKGIEQGSADLRTQMARLEEELQQEKKKYTMLEIRLRNSERAREDAERRNQLLQKEMEEFFATLGSLTVGTKGATAPE
ncbi:Rho GTPase-activating protein 22 [Tupaia chinensis]|uniref:Rho GTPase-activating protein 22 n=1 Tax=Tupaia chinensis TaxID=246437 RepID=L9KVZ5_TUPCH|nr:Rho GTPase-activating protein 22 [Tupaia chinensis]